MCVAIRDVNHLEFYLLPLPNQFPFSVYFFEFPQKYMLHNHTVVFERNLTHKIFIPEHVIIKRIGKWMDVDGCWCSVLFPLFERDGIIGGGPSCSLPHFPLNPSIEKRNMSF